VIDVANALSDIIRTDKGRLLSALIAKFRNFDLAEDALQEALASAHVHWGRSGIPNNPRGWLYAAAGRKAIDRIRKSNRDTKLVVDLAPFTQESDERDADEIPDNRLRLIFTCCHPALEPKSRVALTLRTLGGLTTSEIARAFLDNETTLGQRLSRAKAKIAIAGIPYIVPGLDAWDERLSSVLNVIYLIFNEGYFASSGEIPLRRALCDEAIFLGRLINQLRPDEPEVLGLLALMLFTHARHRARISGAGVVPMEAQNRLLWDDAAVGDAHILLDHALTLCQRGPYQIQAAIAGLHCHIGEKDWGQIMMLYRSLSNLDSNPVIRLNMAVATAEAGFIQAALVEIQNLESSLGAYQPYYAAKAELLVKSGAFNDAIDSYDKAICLATNEADATFLREKRAHYVMQLSGPTNS
jgi:RNA polymerase sigma factor (sigma-70 family)